MADDSGSSSGGNASLVLDIVFEDGSVQKGFVNIANMAKSTAKQVDDGFKGVKLLDFAAIEEQGLSSLRSIGGEFLAFGLAAVAAGLALEGVKKAFELALDGEKIEAVNSQFKILSEQAGISGEALKEGLEKSADGLIDLDDLLKTANSGIINLGGNAARLPEVLDLARKATAALGGSLEERFSGIVSAIETGNARALRSQGIIIDGKKAFEEYAKSIGVSAGELNKAQQQHALLNATIEQGNRKFKDIDPTVQALTNNVARLKTAFKEATDSLAVMIAKSEAFQVLTDAAVGFVDSFQAIHPKETIGSITKEIERLNLEVAGYKKQLANYNFFESFTLGDSTKETIKQLSDQIPVLQARLAALRKEKEAGDKPPPKTGANDDGSGQDQTQILRGRLLAQQLLDAKNAAALAQNQIEAGQTAYILSESDKRIANAQLFEQRRLLVVQQGEIKAAEARAEAAASQTGRADELKTKLVLIATATRTELAKIEQDKIKDTLEYQKAIAAQAARVKAITDGLYGSIYAGTESLGKSLQKGRLDFEDFGNAIANVIGDMAINLGKTLIVQGLAVETFVDSINTLLPGSGAAAAAAGVGLILFGSALKASVGGSSSGATSAAGGSSSYSGYTPTPASSTAQVVQPGQLERAAATTAVNINIQGDVFDSHDTGLRIADLLNTAFVKNGIVLNGAA